MKLFLLCFITATQAGDLPTQRLLVTSVRTGDTEVFIADPVTGDMTNVTRSPQTEDGERLLHTRAYYTVNEVPKN